LVSESTAGEGVNAGIEKSDLANHGAELGPLSVAEVKTNPPRRS
jgi:hypothetical protein